MYKLNTEKYLNDSFDKEKSIEKRKEISIHVLDFYSKNPNIIGIMLVGSLQGLPRDKFSDFDFFLIYHKTPPTLESRIQFMQEHVRSSFIYALNYVSDEYGASDDFDWDGIEVCTSFYSLDEMKKNIQDVLIKMDYKRKGFYYPMAFVAAIADGSILFERQNKLSEFKQQCKKYPENLKNRVLLEEKGFLSYYQDRMNLAAYRNDHIYFNDLVQLFIDSSLQTIFSYNKIYFYSKKEIDKKISKLMDKPNELSNNIQELINIKNNIDQDTFKKKKEIVNHIADSLKEYNSDLPVLDKTSANDSRFISETKKWVLPVSLITVAAGLAFFKLSSKDVVKNLSENFSINLNK